MRVVGGKYKGLRFNPPKNFPSRPTTDYAKEALFNILEHQLELDEITVLDLFAGTGSIGLEFLSRGAKKVISVDINRSAFLHIRDIKKRLEIDHWEIYQNDVFKAVKKVKDKCNIVFADPPFDLGKIQKIPDLVLGADILAEDGILIVEHGKQTSFSKHEKFTEVRDYGGVHFSFFKVD